ncbi:MAG: hypothetical protein KDJ41_00135 [Hyphomicrobiaceae bacterium]|nr:hypothetical protein [Hyphomicrobiaceae bacterium]
MAVFGARTWAQRVDVAGSDRPRRPWRIERWASPLAALLLVAAVLAAMPADDPRQGAETDRLAVAPVPAGAAVAPRGDVFLGAYVGAPYHHRSDVRLKAPGNTDVTFKDVGWYGEPFKHPLYYGARVAVWSRRTPFGTMVDFTHSKALAYLDETLAATGTIAGKPVPARTKIGDHLRRLEFTHGHNMLTLNGLYRLPNLHARVSPYVGLGAGVSLPHSEVQRKDTRIRTYEYQYTGPVLQALVGIELRVPGISYFFEYKFSIARYEVPLTDADGDYLPGDLWRQFKRWWSGKAPVGGYLWTNLASHQVVGGLGVRISRAPAAAR